jgi:hypothetical protein
MTINTIWRVSMQTSHWEFEAFGRTRLEAEKAFKAGAREHAHQCRLPARWVAEGGFDVRTDEIVLGSCLRDNEAFA